MDEDLHSTDRTGVETTVLGFPRIGRDRELKAALEARWREEIDDPELERRAAAARAQALGPAAEAGLGTLPSGDQGLYDHVLDTALMLGAVPERFGRVEPGLPREFAMARGTADAPPLEMTKWFDTNYHYLVPEIARDQRFSLHPTRQLALLSEARGHGRPVRPVVLGPFSFLCLAKPAEPGDDPMRHLDALVPLYAGLVATLTGAGAAGVQIDEPCLALDQPGERVAAAERALRGLAEAPGDITLATYFAGVEDRLGWLLDLPVHRLHLDLARAPEQLGAALGGRMRAGGLSLGLVDGRNVWRADLDAALAAARTAVERLGAERVTLATSCSLLHVPYRAAREEGIDPVIRSGLAFADEKVEELVLLGRALGESPEAADELLEPARAEARRRRESPLVRDAAVRARVAAEGAAGAGGRAPFAERYPRQVRELGLPELPTTTIGSFPQTEELRAVRRRWRAGEMGDAEYRAVLEGAVRETVARQEEMGLDVLVHGEPERTDMVEYFAEHLSGLAVTAHGWVQSYGSRCVKPPVVYGDVARPEPITVGWWRVAQDATARPVKGMLTGPVTILQWSFPREDVPREETARQLALAVGDEVRDLEAAGARVVQVDEPGLREGLPLRASAREGYLRWAVDAFRLATAGVDDLTQVHTHMCYADFDEIVDAVARLDADVISLETSRSGMEPLDAFASYPNAVGPGVYDIHAPRVPPVAEMEELLALAEERVDRARLWVNPDCGLKTRGWEEVTAALANMVEAARRRRAAVGAPQPA